MVRLLDIQIHPLEACASGTDAMLPTYVFNLIRLTLRVTN